MREINQKGLELIKFFEGFKAQPYLDQTGHWTIGYGTRIYPSGTSVSSSDPALTEEQASNLLEDLLNRDFCPQVEKALKVNVTDNQFAALVSFTFNLGIGSLLESTVLRCTNLKNWNDAALAFLPWNKIAVKGQLIVDLGLTKRRQAEEMLFLTP